MLKMILQTLSAVIVGTLISCATETIYIDPPPLPLPVRDTKPIVKVIEFQCLSNDVYSRLRQRENIDGKYIGELEAVIKSTH